MMGVRELLLGILTLTTLALAKQSLTNTVLVVIENEAVRETHSRFINTLAEIGKKIVVRPASEKTISLIDDGEYAYDSIILLCPSADDMDVRLPIPSLIRFVDSGRNLFIAASQSYSAYTEKVAESIGVDLLPRTFKTTDHQQAAEGLDDGTHTYIHAGGHVSSEYLFGKGGAASGNEIVFRGPSASLFKDNELVDAVIWGSGSCYASNGRLMGKVPRAAGNGCVLGAGLSTRVGGRAGYFGSFEGLSDAAFEQAGAGHARKMCGFLRWAVGYAGVLRAVNVRHFSWDEDGRVKGEYRVRDVIRFSVELEQWEGERERWGPYVAEDVQVEFVMMDAWVRKRLVYDGNGSYSADIRVPDQIGVYKFVIEYFRAGVSPIMVSEVVPVRPYLHNEYERFIGMATPYYVASFSMLIGVFLLSIVILYGGQEESSKKDD